MLTTYITDDTVVVRGKLKEALEENGTIQVVGESGDVIQAMADYFFDKTQDIPKLMAVMLDLASKNKAPDG
jgi:DNA-binding NarL/FixJ family response regulator